MAEVIFRTGYGFLVRRRSFFGLNVPKRTWQKFSSSSDQILNEFPDSRKLESVAISCFDPFHQKLAADIFSANLCKKFALECRKPVELWQSCRFLTQCASLPRGPQFLSRYFCTLSICFPRSPRSNFRLRSHSENEQSLVRFASTISCWGWSASSSVVHLADCCSRSFQTNFPAGPFFQTMNDFFPSTPPSRENSSKFVWFHLRTFYRSALLTWTLTHWASLSLSENKLVPLLVGWRD